MPERLLIAARGEIGGGLPVNGFGLVGAVAVRGMPERADGVGEVSVRSQHHARKDVRGIVGATFLQLRQNIVGPGNVSQFQISAAQPVRAFFPQGTGQQDERLAVEAFRGAEVTAGEGPVTQLQVFAAGRRFGIKAVRERKQDSDSEDGGGETGDDSGEKFHFSATPRRVPVRREPCRGRGSRGCGR